MALISERTESCRKRVLDTAGVVREAIFYKLTLISMNIDRIVVPFSDEHPLHST